MTRITTYYGIHRPVPFLNIDVGKDNRLFLDPRAIRLRNAPQPYAAEATAAMDSFFGEVARCVMSSSLSDRRQGLAVLQRFTEPWETRLGLARAGFAGHGGAADVGQWIWDALTADLEALLRVGLLSQIEDLPLFVEGVDRDITSDVTTRIVFDALCNFTSQVLASFPEFTSGRHQVQTLVRPVWDGAKLEWSLKRVMLPVVDSKALVLVPRDWARPTLLMSARRFYDTSVLTYAQLEQAVPTERGGLLVTSKDSLRAQPGLSRGRNTNISVTRRAHDQRSDLIAQFKHFVDTRFAPLADDEILRRTA